MAKQINKAYKDWSNIASTKRYRYFGIRTRVLGILTVLSILLNCFILIVPDSNGKDIGGLLFVPMLISAVFCAR